jgi:transposase
MFAPAILDVPTKPVAKEPEPARASRKKSSSGAIELEIGGTLVRIASGADAATIAAVIQAVKAQS